eukprot:TRINITY_DN8052_c0_g1_i1.p1 TRINITY_DN8052_c0_g1~~TRINITY_DN8052_c0_g1_i1.p1  ORF type:complete len:290 (-),score=16.11 TRINITY_DN8052_c0_g1_i1:55-924(-)
MACRHSPPRYVCFTGCGNLTSVICALACMQACHAETIGHGPTAQKSSQCRLRVQGRFAKWHCDSDDSFVAPSVYLRNRRSSNTKLIHVNSLYVNVDILWQGAAECDVPCSIATKKSSLEHADAVMINFCNPAYDFLPFVSHKRANQKWIFNFHYEAPNVPWCSNQNSHDYFNKLNKSIDWTASFHSESDFQFGMGRLVDSASGFRGLSVKASKPEKVLLWMVSNCKEPHRLAVGRALQKKLPGKVDIFGTCGDASPCGSMRQNETECIETLFTHYSFLAELDFGLPCSE